MSLHYCHTRQHVSEHWFRMKEQCNLFSCYCFLYENVEIISSSRIFLLQENYVLLQQFKQSKSYITNFLYTKLSILQNMYCKTKNNKEQCWQK